MRAAAVDVTAVFQLYFLLTSCGRRGLHRHKARLLVVGEVFLCLDLLFLLLELLLDLAQLSPSPLAVLSRLSYDS